MQTYKTVDLWSTYKEISFTAYYDAINDTRVEIEFDARK